MTDTESVVMNGEGETTTTTSTIAPVKPEVQSLAENDMEVVEGSCEDAPGSADGVIDSTQAGEEDEAMNTSETAGEIPDSSQQGDDLITEEEEEDKIKEVQATPTPEDSNPGIEEEMQDELIDDDDEKQLEIAETATGDDNEQEEDTTPDDIDGDDDQNHAEETLFPNDGEDVSADDSLSLEAVLLNDSNNSIVKTSGSNHRSQASSTAVRNGEATKESLLNSKPLLTGLLVGKGPVPASQSSQSSQNRTFSLADGNVIITELEQQVNKLNQLLSLKEKEWSAILRLKKHMEYALDQVKCTQRISNIQDGLSNGPMSTTDIKACMSLIVSDKETFNLAERQMEENIESMDAENESLQGVFPFRSVAKEATNLAAAKDELAASAALQKLCERKRKAMDELAPGRNTRLRIVDVQSAAPQMQSKVIGNGRKGAIVDVQSIIQSHRNTTGDRLEKQIQKKKVTCSQLINLTPERKYLKTLEDLVAMFEADKHPKELPPPPPIVPQVNVSRSITPKPKNGKPQRQAGSNSLLVNPIPSGSGTLAKMLSPSTHTSMGSSRGSNDVSTTQKYTTKLPNADANLSLANLLATSKVETKVTMSKIKKERNIREDDTSHVPSQQETVPICQGCNLSRAQFVCAGCANQWYCSRECQVAAWDEHSEICSG